MTINTAKRRYSSLDEHGKVSRTNRLNDPLPKHLQSMIPNQNTGISGLLRVVCIALLLCPLPGRADTATDIRNFTGAPTRVVWIQDAGDKANVYSEHPSIRLMGYDTEDGKGERAILP